MNKSKKIILLMFLPLMIVPGIAFGMTHIDYEDPDWQCKKWVGIVELAKQDYPGFVEDTLTMAEKKCGFNVSEFLN